MMPHVVTPAADPSPTFLEFRAGVRSLPYLADHGFEDMVVLPGSFYIDMALRAHRDHFEHVSGPVRNVSFENPVILSTDDTVIRVDVLDSGDGPVEYTFYEAGHCVARLEIDRSQSTLLTAGADRLSIETFQKICRRG